MGSATNKVNLENQEENKNEMNKNKMNINEMNRKSREDQRSYAHVVRNRNE